jgi:hypothetical protein
MPAFRAHDDDPTGAGAAHAKLLQFLEQKLRASDLDEAQKLVEELYQCAIEQPGGGKIDRLPRPGAAMDSGHVYAFDSSPLHQLTDLQAAQAEVAPVVGAVFGDSATTVFRTALRKLGVDARAIHYTALPTVFRQARRSGVRPVAPGMDAAAARSLAAVAPGLARIKHV